VVCACVLAARQPWGGDFGLHAAVVARLRDDLVHPGDPMVEATAPSPYVTPYPVLLALVARTTGWSAAAVVSAAAPFNLALLLYALRRYVGLFAASRWAPVLALAFVALLWGPDAPRWSGFPDVASLPLVLPYPSTLALALALLCWSVLGLAIKAPSAVRWAAAGALGAAVVLVHPFTAVCAALGALALLAGALGRRTVAGAAAAAVLAALLAAAWPYFRLTDLAGAVGELDAIHAPLYDQPLRAYGIAALVGAPALALRARRSVVDPLVLLFVLAGTVVAVGWLSGAYALGRAWPVALLALQVAAAVELVSAVRTVPWPVGGWAARVWAVRLWASVAAAGCLLSLSALFGNLLLVLPHGVVSAAQRRGVQVDTGPNVEWVADRLGPGDVLLTGDVPASRVLLAHGVRFVAAPWPDPLLPDESRRRADLAVLLAPGTPAERRRALLDRYDVRWVLDTDGTARWADRLAREVVDGPGPARLVRIA
jgi:hypothetical protein